MHSCFNNHILEREKYLYVHIIYNRDFQYRTIIEDLSTLVRKTTTKLLGRNTAMVVNGDGSNYWFKARLEEVGVGEG